MKKFVSIIITVQIIVSFFSFCIYAEEKEDWEIYNNYLYYHNEDGHKTEGYIYDYLYIDTNEELTIDFNEEYKQRYFPEIKDKIYEMYKGRNEGRYFISLLIDYGEDEIGCLTSSKENIDEFIEVIDYLKELPFITNVIPTYYARNSNGNIGYDTLISGYVSLELRDGDTLYLNAGVLSKKGTNLVDTRVRLYKDGEPYETWEGFPNDSTSFSFEKEYKVTESGEYQLYVITRREHMPLNVRESMHSKCVTVNLTEKENIGQTKDNSAQTEAVTVEKYNGTTENTSYSDRPVVNQSDTVISAENKSDTDTTENISTVTQGEKGTQEKANENKPTGDRLVIISAVAVVSAFGIIVTKYIKSKKALFYIPFFR